MPVRNTAVPLPAPAPVAVTAVGPGSGRGLAFGALGVAIFAMTLPMTRLAVGDASAPQLPPAFVTAGRAAVAGLLSLLLLWALQAPRPPRWQLPALAVSALGTVLGFPLGLSLALRQVDAMHAAVVTGVLPLATAVAGAFAARRWPVRGLDGAPALPLPRARPAVGFWVCAVLGCTLVLLFAAWKGSGRLGAGDGWLLLAVCSAAIGYVGGARAAAWMPAPQVICWVLVGALPLTLPAALWAWPADIAAVRPAAWLGFGYTALFSMWLGFFAWYRGLALGGVMRVSQVQLLQPFLALLFAVPVLGERLDAVTLLFSLAVMAVVLVGRRLPAPA